MSTFLKTTSTMSQTKCVINLKKPNDTDNKEQVCSFHHLSSIGKSHFSHQRNHRIATLNVSSSMIAGQAPFAIIQFSLLFFLLFFDL